MVLPSGPKGQEAEHSPWDWRRFGAGHWKVERVHGRHRGDHSALLAGASPAAALVQSKRSEQDYCPSLEVLGTQQPFIYLTEKHIYQKEGEGRRRHLGSGQKLVDLDPAHSSLSLASEIPPKWHSVDTVWAVTQVTTTIYTRLFKLWEHA